MTAPELYSIPDVAARLSVSTGTVKRMIAARRIRSVKVGRRTRIAARDLEGALDEDGRVRPRVLPMRSRAGY